jgi:hypothetical protein
MVFEPAHRCKVLRAGALIGVFVALGVFAGACSTSGFQYVSSSDRKAYFKVPSDWKFFDKRDILVASGQSLSAESNRQLSWLIAFDADPQPDLSHVLAIGEAPRYPVLEARVQQLGFQTRDQIALGSLRNIVYPLDRLLQSNQAEMLSYEDIVTDDGFRGTRMVYDIIVGGATGVVQGNVVIRVNQTAILDPASEKLYVFTVRCESHCYRDNKTLIDQIADSWTVKER